MHARRILGIALLHTFFLAAHAMAPEIKALYEQENTEAAGHVKIQNAKLINAVLKTSTQEIDSALAAGASLDHAHSSIGGEPALILAAKYARKTIIPFLLSRNADPNITHSNLIRTALFYAIHAEAHIADKLAMIASLLDGGGDINFRDSSGAHPLGSSSDG